MNSKPIDELTLKLEQAIFQHVKVHGLKLSADAIKHTFDLAKKNQQDREAFYQDLSSPIFQIIKIKQSKRCGSGGTVPVL